MTTADTIMVMNRGRAEQIGSPEDIYQRPGSEFVARFIGGTNILRGKRIGADLVDCGVVVLRCGEGEFAAAGETAVSVRPPAIWSAAWAPGAARPATTRQLHHLGALEHQPGSPPSNRERHRARGLDGATSSMNVSTACSGIRASSTSAKKAHQRRHQAARGGQYQSAEVEKTATRYDEPEASLRRNEARRVVVRRRQRRPAPAQQQPRAGREQSGVEQIQPRLLARANTPAT